MAMARDLGYRSRAHMLATLTAREFREWARFYAETGLCQPDATQRVLAHIGASMLKLGGGKKQGYEPERFWPLLKRGVVSGRGKRPDQMSDDEHAAVATQAASVFQGMMRT